VISPLEDRISRYVGCLDPAVAGQRGHHTTLRMACVLVHGFALTEEQAWPFALDYNAKCMPPWSERDLRRKLTEALRRTDHQQPRGYLLDCDGQVEKTPSEQLQPLPESRPVYDPGKLKRLANKLSIVVNAAYLEARSKYTCWNRSPAGFLHKLYRSGERIIIFTSPLSQGAEIWEHPGLSGNLATLNHFTSGSEQGVWFLCQPVTGDFIKLQRLQSDHNPSGQSRRCEECVTSWRYAVIESDQAPADCWLKVLVQLPLPIAAIYTSAGRSVHTLIRIDADSKACWDAIVRGKMLPLLVQLGADPAAMTAVRLTRLPGCMRQAKGALQQLLYLDDAPDGTPICERARREAPEADWLRWARSLIYWHSTGETEHGTIQRCLAGLQQFANIPAVNSTIQQLEALGAN